jgi:hypothetical protein
MNQSTRIFISLIVVSLLSVMATFAQETKTPTPSGTVTLSSQSIAVGIGINWGTGILTLDGKEHPFSIKGLSVMDLGVSEASVKGEVYHLNKVSDFAGKYAAIEGGFALGKGEAEVIMKNTKGVVMKLQATTKGIQLTLGGKGLSIKLQEK